MARPHAGEELDTVPFGDGRRQEACSILTDTWDGLTDDLGAMETQGKVAFCPMRAD